MPCLISQDLCLDRGFAKLSPKAAVLFLLLLSRLNCHGKMEGDIYAIKGLCCRYIDYISIDELPGLLLEIARSTQVKWWEDSGGHFWVHATKYADYNKGLRKNRMGKDKLPSYQNEELPGVLPREVEVEVEDEVKIGPTIEEVFDYVETRGYHFDSAEFWKYYNDRGWRDKDGKLVKNWKNKCKVWEANALKKIPPSIEYCKPTKNKYGHPMGTTYDEHGNILSMPEVK